MRDLPVTTQAGQQCLRRLAKNEKPLLRVEPLQSLRKVVLAVKKKLPAVGSDASLEDIVGVPAPDWIETFRVELEGSMESRRVVDTKVGSKPVENARLGHVGRKRGNSMKDQ